MGLGGVAVEWECVMWGGVDGKGLAGLGGIGGRGEWKSG